ncbi:MAG TPA: metalloregulator ArsR/SmtB family transcription factor [Oscillatoriaceae cyanobacterium]
MAHRRIAARELAILFSALSHPERLRLVEELRDGERDVASLQAILGVSQAKTSRHLAVLRAHRLVAERHEGRHVYYRLVAPEMAHWVAAGLDFVQASQTITEEIREAAIKSREEWLGQRN